MALSENYPADFNILWAAWPTKPTGRSKKAPSYKAYAKAKKELGFTQEDLDFILRDITERSRTDAKWAEGFVPMMATYLNQRWWNESYHRIRAEQPATVVDREQQKYAALNHWRKMHKAGWALDQIPAEYRGLVSRET